MLEGSNGTNVGADQGSESKSLAVSNQIVARFITQASNSKDIFGILGFYLILNQTFYI